MAPCATVGPPIQLVLGLLAVACSAPESSLWRGDISAETYPEQPMIADIWLEPAPTTSVQLSVTGDPGARIQDLG